MVTTSTCPDGDGCSGPALQITGGAGAVILIAQNGTLDMNGGSGARAMAGKRLTITGGGQVTYESGLADLTLQSNPTGGWNIQAWKEVE